MSILSLNGEVGKAGDFTVEYDADAGVYLIIAQEGSCECTLRMTAAEALAVSKLLMGHATPNSKSDQ